MESVKLTKYEQNTLNRYGIAVRRTNAVFINSNGYKTIKTKRQNIPALSDKIICLHTLFAMCKQVKNLENFSEEMAIFRKMYREKKLETHHKDGNKLNNELSNLIGFLTHREHQLLDFKLRNGGD